MIKTAPNGDFFLAESSSGKISVPWNLCGWQAKANERVCLRAQPPLRHCVLSTGDNPQWVYIGNTDAVVRFPYKNGDWKPAGHPNTLRTFPRERSLDPRCGVYRRRKENVCRGRFRIQSRRPRYEPAEKNRADILEFNPDGSGMRVYAYGIRNAGGGLAINPKTDEFWCSANERDGLGDNLVPDYITHVEDGGFYGWPWWYIGSHRIPAMRASIPN